MTDERESKDRFYWVEGVSRKEVRKQLDDRRPSALRRQRPRRALVALCLAVLVALFASPFLQLGELTSPAMTVATSPSEPQDEPA